MKIARFIVFSLNLLITYFFYVIRYFQHKDCFSCKLLREFMAVFPNPNDYDFKFQVILSLILIGIAIYYILKKAWLECKLPQK